MEHPASVTVAKTAGFCFGVKRAVDRVYELIESEKGPIYTYGPIIHNEQVVEDLKKRGVDIYDQETAAPGSVVVLRSHGVGKQVYRELEEKGHTIVDATCPFVERIHKIVEEESAAGKKILIAGDATHPEVEGIMAFASGEVRCITKLEEIDELPWKKGTPVCFVAQTTFNHQNFQNMVEKIFEKGYDNRIVNTICNATQERQEEAGRLAEASDVMIVVGGRSSSNTQKLYEICKGKCARTYFIQTAEDFHSEVLHGGDNVGITAGASTPSNIIQEVKTKCQN